MGRVVRRGIVAGPAVAGIELRAEKQIDWRRLGDVFVRTDLFARVGSPDSQSILGRRGTGKTHLLRAFQNDVADRGELALYVDCTRVGSGYRGLNLAPQVVAQKHLVTLLNQIGTGLFDKAVRLELPPPGTEGFLIQRLAGIIHQGTVWLAHVETTTPFSGRACPAVR